MALRIDVEVGQTVEIGKSKVTVEDKSGRRARLRIDSEEEVTITQITEQHESRDSLSLSRRLTSG